MNCSEFQHISHELARGQVQGREKIEALAHAGECSRCAEYLQQERTLSLKLGFLSQVMHVQEAPARLEPALLAAFREHAAHASENGSVPLHAGPRYWAHRKFWAWGASAAALAAVLALAIGLRSGQRVPSQPSNAPLASSVAPHEESKAPAPAIVKQDETVVHQAAIQAVKRNRPAEPRGRSAGDEDANITVASGFVPLIYCDELNCGTPGDVVRVELPASSLPMMGLASNTRTGPVRADVVIGEDGIARAIRLVDY